MHYVRLGKTELKVNRNGFGALPIQRIPERDAVRIMHRAFDNGVNYYDTARFYTDSEHKVGVAFAGRRDQVIISTKTGATDAAGFWKDLSTSLRELDTDYIDLYQFHNLKFVPKPNDGTGLYEAMLDARKEGKIRHIGLTNHRLTLALDAVNSGLYETLQFPLSYLSTDDELKLVPLCAQLDVGVIAMKALAGGLITDAATAYAFLAQFPNVEPIWGIQRDRELEDFIACGESEPRLTPEREARIRRDREELKGEFCRGCGYCMPCPAGIEINNCARMTLMLRRAPLEVYLTEDFRDKMDKIPGCLNCGRCKSKCPYHLDIPNLLKRNLSDFDSFWAKKMAAEP